MAIVGDRNKSIQTFLTMFAEAVGLFVFLVAVFVASTIWQNRHLPPGPFPLPVLGNLLSISLDQPYRDFANMARTYGKLFRVQMGSTKVIVINSYEIAKEALVTKAKDFAGRPPHFFGAIFGRDNTDIAFQSYSPRWKLQRKIAITAMRMTEDEVNIPFYIEELKEAFWSQDRKPFNPRDFVGKSIGGCVSSWIFGDYKCNDWELDALLQATHVFNLSIGAANIINTFPVFKYIPFRSIENTKDSAKIRDQIFVRKFQEQVSSSKTKNVSSVLEAMCKEFKEIGSDRLTENNLISR